MADDEPLLYHAPPGPVRTEFRVGLCAWQDRSMLERGRFYPQRTMRPEERLWWYAQFFDCVEVNATFYAPLAAQHALLWARRTPPDFHFGIKAYGLLTGHHLDAARLPEALRALVPPGAQPNPRGQIENRHFPPEARQWAFQAFREALRPLRDQAKLGYVLFQLAPWVRFGREALDYLDRLPAELPGVVVAVEFRHPSWLPERTDAVLRFLAARGLAYVSPDVPLTPAGVARTMALTAPVAVIRLHGRNAQGFLSQLRGEHPGVADKYGYLYGEGELGEIVGRARRLAGHAQRVYLMMNNNIEDAPAINGAQVQMLLDLPVPDRAQVEREWRARRRRPLDGRGSRPAPPRQEAF